MMVTNLPVFIFLFIAALLSVVKQKLTIAGGIAGLLVALSVFQGVGYTGIAMLATFFLLGTVSTKWQINKKQQIGVANHQTSKRTSGQVFANGGSSALLGLVAWYRPEYTIECSLMMAGSLAAATADTLSSELGTIYGKRFYDIITLKKSHAGPDGVISIEGTLIGICGATIIAIIYSFGFGFNCYLFVVIVGGAIGNLADSLLGATLEREHLIGNNVVNFLNTCIGAGICLLLWFLI